MNLNFNLHERQLEVFKSDARFRVVAAGRRFGKTYLSAIELIINALTDEAANGESAMLHEVWYVAPTYGQAKDIMWDMLNDLGRDVIVKRWNNELTVQVANGRKIKLKGADKPDTLRGSAIGFVVLDEFASMKPETWDTIIRPALADTQGRALFIGTPAGKNHFYDVFLQGQNEKFDEWEAFSFKSLDNPLIKDTELQEAANTMTRENFKQEFEASFAAGGGGVLRFKDVLLLPRALEEGTKVIAVDPAGFSNSKTTSKFRRRDETAIVCADVSTKGWHIEDVIHGRWDIRRTSLEIVKAAQKYRPAKLGIESGALKNAIMPYLSDQMKRLNIYFRVEPLKHGGQKKQDRITWSLQGRLENGRISMPEDAKWLDDVAQQFSDFPNPLAHDDLIDAMAYIDQLSSVAYSVEGIIQDDEDWDDIYWEAC